jgi:hypothetical protein
MNRESISVVLAMRTKSDCRTKLSTQYAVLSTQSFIAPLSWLFIVLALIFPSNRCLAQEAANQETIEAAKDALARGGRFPWYDRAEDDVRPLNVVPRDAVQERGDTWIDNSKPPATQPLKTPRISLFGGVLQWVGLTALILLLGLIAYLIATSFLKDETSETVTVRKVVESRRDADRVEALPFHVRAAAGDFLSEARRLYEQGQYSAAIVYLFSHQLVELDKRHLIRLAKGKTNRQYLRETRRQPTIAGILETTMIAFEDAFFGHKTLSREVFERSWRELERFQGELERQERSAA